MTFLKYLSPIRAIQDLRRFLAMRQRHELGFLALSIVLTTLLIAGFVKDSHIEREYRRNIIYVESWPADRSDAEIKAQQAKDAPAEIARREEFRRAQEERRAQFQRLDKKLDKWGF